MSLAGENASWFKTQFDRGCSIQLAIVVYAIAIIICVLSYMTDTDVYLNRCVYRLSGNKDDYTLWQPYLDMARGEEYFIVKPGDDKNRRSELRETADMCPVTVWPITHFLLYVILGFLMPKFFWQLFIISIIWELMEWFKKCQCAMDLLWNLAGLIVGVALRQQFFPYK